MEGFPGNRDVLTTYTTTFEVYPNRQRERLQNPRCGGSSPPTSTTVFRLGRTNFGHSSGVEHRLAGRRGFEIRCLSHHSNRSPHLYGLTGRTRTGIGTSLRRWYLEVRLLSSRLGVTDGVTGRSLERMTGTTTRPPARRTLDRWHSGDCARLERGRTWQHVPWVRVPLYPPGRTFGWD